MISRSEEYEDDYDCGEDDYCTYSEVTSNLANVLATAHTLTITSNLARLFVTKMHYL